MNILLAQLQPELNWPATIKFIIGLVGLLMIIWLVFSVAIAWKKLFGRRPPIGEELDRLEKRIHTEVLEAFDRAYKRAEEAMETAKEVDRRLQIYEKENERSLGRLEGQFRK